MVLGNVGMSVASREVDKAAEYLHHYASREMVEQSVNRLYYGGIQKRHEARQRAEELYNCSPPSVRRTQSEIDAYLDSHVTTEPLKREQRRKDLLRELYPNFEAPPQYISSSAMEKHLKHLYNDPLLKRKAVGVKRTAVGASSTQPHGTSPHVEEDNSPEARERGWRPPSLCMRLQAGQSSTPSKKAAATQRMESPKTCHRRSNSARTPADRERRLQQLSQPLRITPRRVQEEDDGESPPFRVYRHAW